jgi:hypothetical protein
MNREQKTVSARNDNRRDVLQNVPRCGAKTRRKTSCQSPAMANGRCRLHGGLSTGPRTAAGIERIRRANTRHGWRSQAARAERIRSRDLIRQSQATLDELTAMLVQAKPRFTEGDKTKIMRTHFQEASQ